MHFFLSSVRKTTHICSVFSDKINVAVKRPPTNGERTMKINIKKPKYNIGDLVTVKEDTKLSDFAQALIDNSSTVINIQKTYVVVDIYYSIVRGKIAYMVTDDPESRPISDAVLYDEDDLN